MSKDEYEVKLDKRMGETRVADQEERVIIDKRRRDRRSYCWDLQNCKPKVREKCRAYLSGRSCWDMWGTKAKADLKECCLETDDCRRCSLAIKKFGAPLRIYVPKPVAVPAARPVRRQFGCQYFYVYEPEANPDAPSKPLRELLRQDRAVFKCKRRSGVHLDSGYVSDVCFSRIHDQCVFFSDDED